jgi:hypothetical protein
MSVSGFIVDFPEADAAVGRRGVPVALVIFSRAQEQTTSSTFQNKTKA